ncbi:MAG: helix-turn-helix transcriptional regulator [Clostridiales bacterium]|nr:helix-turn-helix transcriptional regulator [Clostridiales bacterium]
MVNLERIKQLAKERGVSIAKLEKETGLANATIRKWESAKPQAENLAKVANFFDVSIEELMA